MIMPTAIADTIKGFIGDDIKSIFKPFALIPAVIFLVLHFIFLLNPLVQQEIALIDFFLSQSSGWQILIVILLIFIFSYILLSLGGFITRIATGEAWADSIFFGWFFTKLQELRRERYLKEYKRGLMHEGEYDYNDEHLQKGPKILGKIARNIVQSWQKQSDFFMRFPIEEGYLAPTSLGNVISATQSYLWQMYRIDLGTMLPILDATFEKENVHKEKINAEKAALSFLLNLGFVLVVFSVEYFIFQLSKGNIGWVEFQVPIILLIVAYFLFYRSAVVQAITWGQAVRNAFILNQDAILKLFGLKEGLPAKEKRKAFNNISDWLVWGHRNTYKGRVLKFPYRAINVNDNWPKDYFIAPDPPKDISVVKSSANIVADVSRVIITDQSQGNPGLKIASYLVLIDYKKDDEANDGKNLSPANGIYLLIADSKVSVDPGLSLKAKNVFGIESKNISGTFIQKTSGEPSSFNHLWFIKGDLEVNGACGFEYEIGIKE